MMTKLISNIKYFVVAFLLTLGYLFLSPGIVIAQERSFVYETIDVTIDQNKDSTMDVTEVLRYRFNGEYHAITRDIRLISSEALQRCKENQYLLCGGFETLDLLEVRDNDGNLLEMADDDEITYTSNGNPVVPPNKYLVLIKQDGSDKIFAINWIFSEEGINFNNEVVTFSLKYKVFGAPGYFDDHDLLYWNAIWDNRDYVVERGRVTINYPGPVDTSSLGLTVPGHGTDYSVEAANNGTRVIITKDNLLPGENLTILQKLPKGMIDKYATLNLKLNPKEQDLVINDVTNFSGVSEKVAGLPPGEHKLVFSQNGRIPKEFNIKLEPGEIKNLDVSLELTREERIRQTVILALNLFGAMLLPLGALKIYQLWKTKGRDHIDKSIVIPEYSPPDEIRPYLLGSLKDEMVDIKDITSSIIDLAYRGYIKIKEFGAKEVLGIKLKKADFELIKQKEFDDLSEPEKELMDAVFGTKERVTTNDLKNKFYTRLPGIKKKIYEELVSAKYFDDKPDSVRTKYLGIGFLVMIVGVGLVVASTVLPIFWGTGIALGILGLVLLIVSKHMPSKTELGSQIFHKVLGFKMYMETAEKYRVQNLTPETFEKFLPYAIVFGIEKQWAEKFKDIYKGTPDWYEGDISTFNTIYLVNSLSTFNTTTATAMTVSPSSSGTATGGGWSGGGGFSGGFSGGGGGGGGSGAW
ncbi:MAG TPA: DUF2207 domain-containing protein [Candidatus Dojkabacteria bacterium]|nr:DUF2207 domain-containing protein [Candidatus Dojkabacteria bacterium]HRP50921.1 DUF2207 domain-containing protein [Candidatus Dojkabacteria bacterium]